MATQVPGKTNDKLRDEVNELFNVSNEQMREWHDRITKWYALYHSQLSDQIEGRANLFVPLSFEAVETMRPRIMYAMFGHNPWFKVSPQEESDIKTAEMWQQVMMYQFSKNRMWNETYMTVGDAGITGTGVSTIQWEDIVEAGHKLYTGWTVRNFPLWDFFPDPYATCVRNMQYVILRYEVSKAYLKAQAERGLYKDVDDIPQSQEKNDTAEEITQYRGVRGDKPKSSHDMTQTVILHECLKNTGELITVANSEKVIRHEKKFPLLIQERIALLRDVVTSNSLFGIGELEPIESLQDELNGIRNNRMDNVNLTLNNCFISRGQTYKASKLITSPGAVISIDGQPGQDFIPLDVKNVTAGSWQEEGALRNDYERALGIYEYFRGATPQRAETASTVMALQQAADYRFSLKAKVAAEEYLHPILTAAMRMNQKWLPKSMTIRIAGKKGIVPLNINKKDLRGDYDFEFIFEPQQTSKEVTRAQWVQAVGMLNQNPHVNQYEVAKETFERFDVQDVDRFLTTQGIYDVMRDPEVENLAMSQGQKVEVHPDDVHEEHMAWHQAALHAGEFDEGMETQLAQEHLATHLKYMNAAQAMQQKMMAQQPGPQEWVGGSPPNVPPAAQGQTPGVPQAGQQMALPSDMQQMPMETIMGGA